MSRRKPKRLFRDRRAPAQVHDRRRVEHGNESIIDPPDLTGIVDVTKCLVYVPVHRFVDCDTWNCIEALRDLDFEVHLSKGASAIDMSRSLMASEAVLGGFEQLLFIDSDMLFDPADAIRLFQRPEPVVGGVYAAKALGERAQLNVDFGPRTEPVKFGPWAGDDAVPVERIGAGFLRIKTDLLRRMVAKLRLPYCHMGHSAGWPFFQPMIVDQDTAAKYLTEDYAFCRRCCDMGEPPAADTTIRLYHLGDHTYGLEEGQGMYVPRQQNHLIDIVRPPCGPLVAPAI